MIMYQGGHTPEIQQFMIIVLHVDWWRRAASSNAHDR